MNKAEIHILVLWQFARAEESRIRADIKRHVTILSEHELSWPIDPVAAFRKFYGAKLADARGKVSACGGGSFRLFVVRDERARYVLRNTSRGIERVNARLFAMKDRYRRWTGGGHKVHTSNSVEEARRDLIVLTGHRIDEWLSGSVPTSCAAFPGLNGWESLRQVFDFLGETTRYAVIRNFETLPDAFDPAIHGDIDFLVDDAAATADLLHARRVFPEPWRVHYELKVDGRPVRVDFRFVGDGYYCDGWEREILLTRRALASGIFVPSAENAFFALVYHALYQKRAVAVDYHDKAAALAAEAGIEGGDFDEWFSRLDAFLVQKHYAVCKPDDQSVYFNRLLAGWKSLAGTIAGFVEIADLHPVFLAAEHGCPQIMPTLFLSGTRGAEQVIVKYTTRGAKTVENEYVLSRRVWRRLPDNVVKLSFWHRIGDRAAFSVMARLPGVPLGRLLSSGTKMTDEIAERIALDCQAISDGLLAAGIVHRDLQPGNLIVDAQGHVRLIDFQLAIEKDNPCECGFLARRHYEILSHLGRPLSTDDGVWNDRLSMLKIVRMLPRTAARDCVEAALAADAGSHAFVACIPRQMLRGIFIRYVLLSGRNLLRRIFWLKPKRAKYVRHLSTVLRTWRFADPKQAKIRKETR